MKIDWAKNKMRCAADNHNDTCHTCAKGFLDINLSTAVNSYWQDNFFKTKLS